MVSLEPSLIQDSIGPEVTLNVNDPAKFCSIIENNDKSYKSVRTDKVSAPMDFAVAAGWQLCIVYIRISVFNDLIRCFFRPCIKSIFPSVIDGDLLNSFISRTFSAWLKVLILSRLVTCADPRRKLFL